MEDEQNTEKQELKQDATAQGQKGKAQFGHPKVILLVIFFIASLITLSSIYFFRFHKPATSPITSSKTALKPTLTNLSPTPPDGSIPNWKIYRNSEFNFEFEYPKEFEFRENRNNKDLFTIYFIKGTGTDYDWFSIGVDTIKNDVNLKNWVDEHSLIQYEPNGKKYSIIIGEILSYKNSSFEGYTFIGNPESIIKYVFTKRQNHIFSFLLGYGPTGGDFRNSKEGQKIFDRVLSTFKFIDQITPNPTATTSSGNSQVCIQVITPARNPRTGQCQDFPTPCDIPSGWEKVQSCAK